MRELDFAHMKNVLHKLLIFNSMGNFEPTKVHLVQNKENRVTQHILRNAIILGKEQ